MNELSHVGMGQCYFCGSDSVVLLDRRLKKSLPRKVGVVDMEPCNDCKGHMKLGIVLISIADSTTNEQMKGRFPNPCRTGGWVVVTQDFVERIFSGEVKAFALGRRFSFITDEAWEMIGLPRE